MARPPYTVRETTWQDYTQPPRVEMRRPFTLRVKSSLRPFWWVFDQFESLSRAQQHAGLALTCGATGYQIATIDHGYTEIVIEEG
jgi:hypothetical protein